MTDELKASWTRQELRKALLELDKLWGSFPEDAYQGLAVWNALCGMEPENLKDWEDELDGKMKETR